LRRGLPLRRRVRDRAVVLRPEAFLERPRAPRAERAPDDDRQHDDCGDRDHDPYPTWHDVLPSLAGKRVRSSPTRPADGQTDEAFVQLAPNFLRLDAFNNPR